MANDSTEYNVGKMEQQSMLLGVLEALALDNRVDQFLVHNRILSDETSSMNVTFSNLDSLNVFTATYEWSQPSWIYKSVIEHSAKIV